MMNILSRLNKGATMGLNIQWITLDLQIYNSSPILHILNALGIMAGGYLLRYDILGYNIYLYYLAIFLFTCFFISHVYIAIDKWIGLNNRLNGEDFDLKNPNSDKLVIRTARFVARVKALTPQIRPLWTIVCLILGCYLIQTPPQVEKKIIYLIISLLEELEKNNKYIKELTILTKGLTEWGITDDCMKRYTIEVIKEIDKQKADLVKSNCNLNEEIVDILKSNLIKKK